MGILLSVMIIVAMVSAMILFGTLLIVAVEGFVSVHKRLRRGRPWKS